MIIYWLTSEIEMVVGNAMMTEAIQEDHLMQASLVDWRLS